MNGIQECKLLKYSFKNHLVLVTPILVVATVVIGIMASFRFSLGIIIGAGIFLLLDVIPAFYLHIEYWIQNRNEQYIIKEDELIVHKRDHEIIIKRDQIEKSILVRSASVDKGGFPILAMEYYYHVRIKLKSGDDIILTNLLSTKLYEKVKPFVGYKVERKKSAFCTIGLSR